MSEPIIPGTVYDGFEEMMDGANLHAFRAGAEAMREMAAKWLEADGTLRPGGISAIRALPLPDRIASR